MDMDKLYDPVLLSRLMHCREAGCTGQDFDFEVKTRMAVEAGTAHNIDAHIKVKLDDLCTCRQCQTGYLIHELLDEGDNSEIARCEFYDVEPHEYKITGNFVHHRQPDIKPRAKLRKGKDQPFDCGDVLALSHYFFPPTADPVFGLPLPTLPGIHYFHGLLDEKDPATVEVQTTGLATRCPWTGNHFRQWIPTALCHVNQDKLRELADWLFEAGRRARLYPSFLKVDYLYDKIREWPKIDKQKVIENLTVVQRSQLGHPYAMGFSPDDGFGGLEAYEMRTTDGLIILGAGWVWYNK